MHRSTFRGIFVIVTTPFNEDLSLDEHGLERTMEFCLAAGVRGVVANALASEGGYLTEAERRRAAEIIVGKARGRVPAVVSVSAPHYRIAIDYAQHAESIGANAIMALPPTLHPSTGADVKSFYRALSQATPVPLIVQNVVGQAATTMGAHQIAELVNELPNDGQRARDIFRRLLPLLDMGASYGMPLMKEVLRMRGVIDCAAVRQSGFRPLDHAAREEAAAIMDDFADFMLPRYGHRR